MTQAPLSELDQKIVSVLQLNGRASWKTIAPWVGASESTVQRRYQALCTAGILRIVGSYDVTRTGSGLSILVRISCKPGSIGVLTEALAALPQTRMIVVVSGTADLIVDIVAEDRETLTSLLLHDLPLFELIVSTESLAVIRVFTMAPRWDTLILPPEAVEAIRGHVLRDCERPGWRNVAAAVSDTERAILAELSDDGRRSHREIAEQIGRSEATVRRGITRMIDENMLQFRTMVEPHFLGYEVEFMLWIQVEPAHLDEAGRQLGAHPATKFLAATTGRFNLVGQVVLPRTTDLYDYTTNVIGELPGVQLTDITLQLATVKRGWHRVDTYQMKEASA